MYVLFIVLNEPEYLSEVLFKMKQQGLRGATVIDSMGASALNKDIYNIPVLGGFMKTMDGDITYNKTIFSVIERDQQVHRIMEAVEKIIGGDMKKPNKGIMFVLPVTHMRGGELGRHIKSRDNKLFLEDEFTSEYY